MLADSRTLMRCSVVRNCRPRCCVHQEGAGRRPVGSRLDGLSFSVNTFTPDFTLVIFSQTRLYKGIVGSVK